MSCEIDLATTVAARLSIQKFPGVEFFAQTYAIPAITAAYPKIQGPRVASPMPPQSVVYQPLNVTYLLVEDMSNHKLIVDWMQGSTTDVSANIFSDASLFILGAQRSIKAEVKFFGIVPVAISAIEYVTTAEQVIYQKATVTFDYTYYRYV